MPRALLKFDAQGTHHHSLTHSSTRPLTHSPTHSPTHLSTYPPTHPPTYPPTHLLTYPPTHQPTHHLQFLGNLFEFFLARRSTTNPGVVGQKATITVLGATSGDTGSAAIQGLRGKAGVEVYILHPHERVAPVQEAQMTTVRCKTLVVSFHRTCSGPCAHLVLFTLKFVSTSNKIWPFMKLREPSESKRKRYHDTRLAMCCLLTCVPLSNAHTMSPIYPGS
jgi:hypothetical protein